MLKNILFGGHVTIVSLLVKTYPREKSSWILYVLSVNKIWKHVSTFSGSALLPEMYGVWVQLKSRKAFSPVLILCR
jgi:hypothetical protein